MSFPYTFWQRETKKKPKTQLSGHDRLGLDSKSKDNPGNQNNSQRYDVAFEVEWTNETPLAAMPVPKRKNDGSFEYREDSKGNKQNITDWLTFNDTPNSKLETLAISTFTVKGAIESAYANLMGGCYRESNTYYDHRVSRDRSKPGIFNIIRTNGIDEIIIQPVREYLTGEIDELIIDSAKTEQGLMIDSSNINFFRDPSKRNPIKVGDTIYYHSKYKFGMFNYIYSLSLRKDNITCRDNELREIYGTYPETMDKDHYKHRFYTIDSSYSVKVPKTIFNAWEKYQKNSQNVFEKLKSDNPSKYSSLEFCSPVRKYNNISPEMSWQKEDWIYYLTFDTQPVRIASAIGTHYQFCAAFFSDITVPTKQKACNSADNLCPRCSLFGIANPSSEPEAKNKDSHNTGFAGRFKSSCLVSKTTSDSLKSMLLPILAEPKPDNLEGKYYQDGYISGSKYYNIFSNLDENSLNARCNKSTQREEREDLRTTAQILYKSNIFTGTLGAENVDIDELSALIHLLHSPVSSSKFQIGLGKPLGMGLMKPVIAKIWIRKNELFSGWEQIDSTKCDTLDVLNAKLNKKVKVIALKELQNINGVVKNAKNNKKTFLEQRKSQKPADRLEYPAPGPKYWNQFGK